MSNVAALLAFFSFINGGVAFFLLLVAHQYLIDESDRMNAKYFNISAFINLSKYTEQGQRIVKVSGCFALVGFFLFLSAIITKNY